MSGPSLLNNSLESKSAEELRQIFEAQGVDVNKPMAFTCTAGVLSSLAYACAVKANFPGKLYFFDGSWSEFSDKKKKEEAAQSN